MTKYRYRVTAVPQQGWVCEIESFTVEAGWTHEWTFPGASTREVAKSYFDRWLTERNDGWVEVDVNLSNRVGPVPDKSHLIPGAQR